MRSPLRDTIAYAIPAVHRAVVQLEGAQRGHAAPVQDLERILYVTRGQKDAESRNVLLDDLEHRFVHPVISEVYARAHLAQVEIRAPRIDRLLEKRDPRLPPEAISEEQRRVRGGGEHRGGHGLGHIVQASKLVRVNLKVRLEAGIAPLQRNGFVLDVELVRTADVQLGRPAP